MHEHLEYVKLGQLGNIFGGSSHVAGKALKKVGLRMPNGQPSEKAHDGRFCKQIPTGRGRGFYYIWHREKTIRVLEAAGYNRADQGEPVASLHGPFDLHQSGTDTWEIRDGDGSVGVWVIGERDAENLLKVMNLAYEYSHLLD